MTPAGSPARPPLTTGTAPRSAHDTVAAVRSSYDTVAVAYASLLADELADRPLERAVLSVFAGYAAAAGGPVVDAGCGPGRVTALLRDLGVPAFGVDLSPGMVAEARRRHPDLRFEVGTTTALDAADGSLGGVLAWYSLVHTPPEELPRHLAEFHRVLTPGGPLLLAFKAGDERVRLERAYGHPVDLDVYRFSPARVARLLGAAGFVGVAGLVRAAEGTEATPQAFLLARKSA